ncbi:unnamed protein product [Paramecium pentaurelia]|uniref:Uncharacterized protein n=1 Tax=Paramecium pentaurelia TaxID=43138 RepID=A0A8S1YNC3_9CILI|nr:unnamed protein product [Paramecium pentaurelia]
MWIALFQSLTQILRAQKISSIEAYQIIKISNLIIKRIKIQQFQQKIKQNQAPEKQPTVGGKINLIIDSINEKYNRQNNGSVSLSSIRIVNFCLLEKSINMLREVKDNGWFQGTQKAKNELTLQPYLAKQDYIFDSPFLNTELIRPSSLTQLSKDCLFDKQNVISQNHGVFCLIIDGGIEMEEFNWNFEIILKFDNSSLLLKEVQNNKQLTQEELNTRIQAFQV